MTCRHIKSKNEIKIIQKQLILQAFHGTIHILIHSPVIFAQSPIAQQAMAASTPHPVRLMHSYPTNQHHFLSQSENNMVKEIEKNVYLLLGFASEREKKRKKKRQSETESQITFSSVQLLLHSSVPALCQRGRDVHRHAHYEAHTHTAINTHLHTHGG